ncbi:MAG: hypothetical protein AAF543_01390 [Pseudomonadota bacterium]
MLTAAVRSDASYIKLPRLDHQARSGLHLASAAAHSHDSGAAARGRLFCIDPSIADRNIWIDVSAGLRRRDFFELLGFH